MIWWILLFVLALLLVGLGRRVQRISGMPVGPVVYSDYRQWGRVERTFFSSTHQVSGKPDYLVRSGKIHLPVEVKSSRAPLCGPHSSHVHQLAAYCLLVEDQLGVRPTHGLIKYNDGVFEVEYTPQLKRQLLQVLDAMREDAVAVEVDRSHQESGRCRGCGLQSACGQCLS